MFAVIETGGKQYRVSVGQSIAVEQIAGGKGDTVELDRILILSTGEGLTIGTPHVEDAKVVATVSRQFRGPKLLAFRYKSKKRVRVLKGHRQSLTQLFIRDIVVNGQSTAQATAAADA